MKKLLSVGFWTIFIFYIYLLFDTVFLSRDARRNLHLIPFDTIVDQGLSLNVYGNIIMFIPLGLYAAYFMKQFSVWKALLTVIIASLSIEIIQFIFKRGITDIDDVILNTVGGFIGILLYFLLQKVFNTKSKIYTAISTLSLLIGIPVVLLVAILTLTN